MKSVLKLAEHRHRTSGKAASFIEHHRFTSVYQPILSPTHQKLVGYEALVRIRRGDKRISPPALFEQANIQGVTAELDKHLLGLHLDNFGFADQPAWLFINLNPDTLIQHEGYLEQLAEHCERNGMAPEKVVLELVETRSRDTGTLLEFVDQAKALGFRIAIDDFGMGDSNFERLWRIDPLIVKIDRSLLVNAASNQRARLLLDSLVRMIRESGSLVLIEGIEDEAQARIALDSEADLVQGFLFEEPSICSRLLSRNAEQSVKEVVDNSRQWSLDDHNNQETYLQLLRFEILDTCHQLARGEPLDQVCDDLLALEGVQRCFVLNGQGIQQGSLARSGADQRRTFNPLYHSSGARWNHREYFRNALEKPQQISCSRPYVGLPDAKRTITLSTCVSSEHHQVIFCIDIHPDDVMGGQLVFPVTL
ncbi:EAL domain-containing protein [Marinobacter oulmenensis]|uniref:EAL domain-containing protein (Putative c-di-GMP-specific phosphodiesterase class I) n=1 Tax=Marinobacter oulmenensis TaxID=643747 RepID=A0A840ULX3_9GAMM|nr:EAL domain-containing protein [Marinobacter oulmenensis]MBB5321688.1 EAL domain-containing protein (putative c-di-GMP-specific phosphodiesterase class I) [Marinobacter oulmenensis]